MDYDGFLMLIDRDYKKFKEWQKNTEKLSLEQLRNDYNDWNKHVMEAYDKHWHSEKYEENKDATLFVAKLVYLYYLTNFAWWALSEYTHKLRSEYEKLKETKKHKKKTKRKL